MLAWHFIHNDGTVRRYYDGRGQMQPHGGIAVTPGQTLRVCGLIGRGSVAADPTFARGLFGSVTPAEALFHAPGLVVCRVRLSGQMIRHEHYAQAEMRTCLWRADATRAVWEWGTWCAARAILCAQREGHGVEWQSEAAVKARFRWLRGQATLADVEATCGPALQAYRRANGRKANGKPSETRPKAPVCVQHAARLAYALTQVSRSTTTAWRPGVRAGTTRRKAVSKTPDWKRCCWRCSRPSGLLMYARGGERRRMDEDGRERLREQSWLMAFGRRVRAARKTLGLSQQETAAQVGRTRDEHHQPRSGAPKHPRGDAVSPGARVVRPARRFDARLGRRGTGGMPP